jgi:hypothetical protein
MAGDDVLEWPVRTAEYMHFDVTADHDPLADDVKVGLPDHRVPPVDADYHAAEWVPGQTWTANSPIVRVRYFVDANTLTRGQRYDAWVQLDDDPETPEIFAGVVKGV